MTDDKRNKIKILNLLESLAELTGDDFEEAKIVLRAAGKDPDAILKKGMEKLKSIQGKYKNQSSVPQVAKTISSQEQPMLLVFKKEGRIVGLDSSVEGDILNANEAYRTFVKQLPLRNIPYSHLQLDEDVQKIKFQRLVREIHFKIEMKADHASVLVLLKDRQNEKILTVEGLQKAVKAGYIILQNSWYPLDEESTSFASGLIPFISSESNLPLNKALEIYSKRRSVSWVSFPSEELDFTSIINSDAYSTKVQLFERRLYPYQQDGLKWLQYCCLNRIGGLLGDDMGLGKTAQIIALIAWTIEKNLFANILIVVPSTLLENWNREFKFFAPSIDVYTHHGNIRTGSVLLLRQQKVVLTSYSLVVNDRYLFDQMTWGIVVVDEASLIKNSDSERRNAIMGIPSEIRIAMTGTPVENSLLDLWSLGDYVNPGYFGSKEEFSSRYIKKDIERTLKDADLSALKAEVSFIMLRRKKEDVLESLPEKIDIHQALVMDDWEAALYEEQRERIIEENRQNPGVQILKMIQELRQFTTHPLLKDKSKIQFADLATLKSCSVKFSRTIELLDQIQERREKVIVFTEYLDMIDCLERVLGFYYKVPVFTIDGRVEPGTRQINIDKFTATEGFSIMILNPKSAGMGLNITAANHVIHYTRQWNPALEQQASARSYRNGQKKGVNVYYLFYSDTIEEDIDNRLRAKTALSGEVISETQLELGVEEYLNSLSKSPFKNKKI